MDIKEVKPDIFFVDLPGVASNSGFIRTSEGIVLIDTTTGVEPMQDVLDTAGLRAEEICLVILTHADGDHTGGNSLFDCPILAHTLSKERMVEAGKPKKELPTEVFEDHYEVEVGDVCFELTHYGGHKVDASVVWLPQHKVLFAGDLLFEGRYPYILSSDVPRWIEALGQLPSYGAEVILPGHGTICTPADIDTLKGYLADTWQRTADHIAQGHTLEETLADPDFFSDDTWLRENLYEPNIEFMYQQLSDK